MLIPWRYRSLIMKRSSSSNMIGPPLGTLAGQAVVP